MDELGLFEISHDLPHDVLDAPLVVDSCSSSAAHDTPQIEIPDALELAIVPCVTDRELSIVPNDMKR